MRATSERNERRVLSGCLTWLSKFQVVVSNAGKRFATIHLFERVRALQRRQGSRETRSMFIAMQRQLAALNLVGACLASGYQDSLRWDATLIVRLIPHLTRRTFHGAWCLRSARLIRRKTTSFRPIM